MKKFFVLFFMMTGLVISAMACEIDFAVSEKSVKKVYSVGDELIVNVQVILTHRNCHVDISDTEFECDGLKIKQATKWKEVKPGVWTRKLKIEVTGSKSGELSISGTRTCNKEGGYGILELKGEK